MTAYRIPAPLGAGANVERIDAGTAVRMRSAAPVPLGTGAAATPAAPKLDEGTRQLAATAYGEASTADVYEEIAAIANVLVRQQKARGYADIGTFIRTDKTFAFAAHDGNARYGKLMKAKADELVKNAGYASAVKAAQNALSATPIDYSNGAYFWDGADIKSNYAKHAKVRAGIRITDPLHNIYGIDSKDVPDEEWWRDAKGKKTRLRGKWDYKYESTAGYGGTIFWKYNPDFVKATANKVYD